MRKKTILLAANILLIAILACNFPTPSSGTTVASTSRINNLARIFESQTSLLVENPLSQQATVSLEVRRIDVPIDWMVFVTPSTMTLEAGESMTATVTITAMDADVPSVTVKDEDGRTMSFKIADKKNLEGVKVGDRVDITYTAAGMITVK